jgi:hypothetical protein
MFPPWFRFERDCSQCHCNLVQCKNSIDRAHLDGFSGHAKDNGRCLILCNREGAGMSERKQAGGTVPTHPGQKARGSFWSDFFGKRFEKHIDRGPTGIPLAIRSEPELPALDHEVKT